MPFSRTNVTEIMIKKKLVEHSELDEIKIGIFLSGYKKSTNKYLTPNELGNIQNKAHKRFLRSRLFWSILKQSYLIGKVFPQNGYKTYQPYPQEKFLVVCL